MNQQDFLSTFPPNARVLAMSFESDVLVVDLDGTGEVRVPSGRVTGIYGAGLSRESTHLETERKFVEKEINSGPLIFGGKSTRLVREVTTKIVTNKDIQPVLALRVTDVAEVWYVQTTSFNYRRTLGPDMSYAAGMNLKNLVRRLVAHCPQASRDEYVQALSEGLKPPEPLRQPADLPEPRHRRAATGPRRGSGIVARASRGGSAPLETENPVHEHSPDQERFVGGDLRRRRSPYREL